MNPARWSRWIGAVAMMLGLTGSAWTGQRPTTALEAPANGGVQVQYASLPLHFEANQGQADSQVQFLSHGRGYSLLLTPTEAVLALQQAQVKGEDSPRVTRHASREYNQAVLRMKLVGANSHPTVNGLDALPGKANYFIGNDPKQWRTNIPTYAKIRYRDIYPGIDLVYYGNQRQLEHDFVVAPGADPDAIAMRFEGAASLEVDAHGDLVLHVSDGDVRLHKPLVYQDLNGTRQPIAGNYVLNDQRQASFQVAAYDASRPLVIDPVLSYSTYLGGTNSDNYSLNGSAVAVDASGNAYVTGTTYSSDFPTANAIQPTRRGYTSVFVSKLNPTGSALIYSTFLGGSSAVNWGFGITVDSAGNAYVTGSTNAPDFPTVNPLQPALAGSAGTEDAFVAKLDPAGSALIYSTYLGGSNNDRSLGITADSNGSAYVTGWTGSSDFPTVNALQPALLGGGDAFVAKLTADGSALVYSTYLGGSADDWGFGITVDAAGNCYVTGATGSADFPTSSALQPESSDIAMVYKSVDGGQSWSPSGLKGVKVNALAIDPAHPSTLFAGSAEGAGLAQPLQRSGVYKSADGGASWTAVLEYSPVTSLAIDPLDPLTVYAGTYGLGLFKSMDGGATWSGGCTDRVCTIRALATDPLLSLSLYAGISFQVAKTMTGGATWTYGWVASDSPVAIRVDPSNPSILYAGTTRSTPTGGGVFKSVDAGTTWVRVARFSSWPGTLDVPAIAIDPLNTSTVYAGAARTGIGGVFKTTDGGLTWVAMNAGLDVAVLTLAVDPTNPAILYAGTSSHGVFKSSDGAGSWTAANNGLSGLSITALAIDPADPSTLYAGTVGGASDAFVAKVDTSGSRLVYSTYLGGGSGDVGRGIAVDSQGNVYLTGSTGSANFPRANALQPTLGGASDAFIAKFDPTGSALIYSTYFGGGGNDLGYAIAVDPAGNAYVAGATTSTDFPTMNAVQPTNAGYDDAFVAKISE